MATGCFPYEERAKKAASLFNPPFVLPSRSPWDAHRVIPKSPNELERPDPLFLSYNLTR